MSKIGTVQTIRHRSLCNYQLNQTIRIYNCGRDLFRYQREKLGINLIKEKQALYGKKLYIY